MTGERGLIEKKDKMPASAGLVMSRSTNISALRPSELLAAAVTAVTSSFVTPKERSALDSEVQAARASIAKPDLRLTQVAVSKVSSGASDSPPLIIMAEASVEPLFPAVSSGIPPQAGSAQLTIAKDQQYYETMRKKINPYVLIWLAIINSKEQPTFPEIMKFIRYILYSLFMHSNAYTIHRNILVVWNEDMQCTFKN
jgi:hypothetical protein